MSDALSRIGSFRLESTEPGRVTKTFGGWIDRAGRFVPLAEMSANGPNLNRSAATCSRDGQEHDTMSEIHNRMQDCGNGRHVGWWSEELGLKHQSLLVEVKPGIFNIACCEGNRSERRIYYVTGLEEGVEIVRAMAKALGYTLEPVNTPATPPEACESACVPRR